MQKTMNKDLQQCAKECLDCFQICSETFYQYCLVQGGEHTEPKHFKLMQDCINICRTSAEFLLRGSENHKATCRACAEICQKCADDCVRFNDPQMKACADACRKCAEMCKQMSQ